MLVTLLDLSSLGLEPFGCHDVIDLRSSKLNVAIGSAIIFFWLFGYENLRSK